eukprot:c10687_g1_i1.p1 GENE.c10687_g1_i1~~c10687_g1_i1.p1  ORF type:complete len:505 (-),score=100.79 c10687_g1_i1:288-1802(-)
MCAVVRLCAVLAFVLAVCRGPAFCDAAELPTEATIALTFPSSNRYSASVATFSGSMPTNSHGQKYRYVLSNPPLGCISDQQNYTNSIVLVERGNCTFVEKAKIAAHAGAFAVVILNNDTTYIQMSGTWDESLPRLPVVLLPSPYSEEIFSFVNSTAEVLGTIFAPTERGYGSMVALWFMAVGTVVVGSIWAAPSTGERSRKVAVSNDFAEAPPTVEITAYAAVGFVVVASLSLVILFFFMKRLILLLIVFFCLGSLSALHMCLYSLIVSFTPISKNSQCMAVFDLPCFGPCNILGLVLLAVSCGISITFFVCRHDSYAWVLQDIMGISMCLMFLRTFRFPNAKVSMLLMVLAFFYDIFWVFLSPYFFHGESVMVRVATGGGSKESIPMLLKFPNACEGCSASLLGLGDIVLPGLFVAFTLAFDRAKALRYVNGYFLYNAIGYGVGLLITYAALLAMGKGQPALLYLVPCTLGVTLTIAFIRGHLREMWVGPSVTDVSLAPLIPR